MFVGFLLYQLKRLLYHTSPSLRLLFTQFLFKDFVLCPIRVLVSSITPPHPLPTAYPHNPST
ncbi:MAG: hypothetical protein N3C57_02945 [Aquificaceae bacterium]|nr:hypothetical protein [Aquificaceae bacterium]